MDYYVIEIDRDIDGAAQIEGHPKDVRDVVKSYKFRKAVPLSDKFPESPGYAMSPEYPDNRILTDFQDNTNGLMIISESFADIVRSLDQQHIELLPIKIIDHRGKVASASYFIANIIGTIDCMDMDKSVYVVSAMDADELFSIEKMVINEARIPEDLHLFRLFRKATLFIVSEELKRRVEDKGLTGMKFTPVQEFDDS